jgi:hypothetical protein
MTLNPSCDVVYIDVRNLVTHLTKLAHNMKMYFSCFMQDNAVYDQESRF